MAGSRRPFVYTSDSGEQFLVQLDETIYEEQQLGFKSTLQGGSASGVIIRGNPIKMRYINCYRQQEGVTVRARFFVGDPTEDIYKNGGALVFGQEATANAPEKGIPWLVSSSIGEKRKFIGLIDTGKTEGDVDQIGATLPPAP